MKHLHLIHVTDRERGSLWQSHLAFYTNKRDIFTILSRFDLQ